MFCWESWREIHQRVQWKLHRQVLLTQLSLWHAWWCVARCCKAWGKEGGGRARGNARVSVTLGRIQTWGKGRHPAEHPELSLRQRFCFFNLQSLPRELLRHISRCVHEIRRQYVRAGVMSRIVVNHGRDILTPPHYLKVGHRCVQWSQSDMMLF